MIIYSAFLVGLIIGMIIAYTHSFYEYEQIKKIWRSTIEMYEKAYKELSAKYIKELYK